LPKVVVETQTEAFAYVVSRAVGLETNSAAPDYIALYHGDKKTLAQSLAVIHVTSSRILDELLPQQRVTPGRETQRDGRAFGDKRNEPERQNQGQPTSATQAPDQSDSIFGVLKSARAEYSCLDDRKPSFLLGSVIKNRVSIQSEGAPTAVGNCRPTR
jgi:hypothetical protein